MMRPVPGLAGDAMSGGRREELDPVPVATGDDRARIGLAATAVLAFLWTWNDLLVTLVRSTRAETEMLPLGITTFVLEHGVDWGSMTAAGMLMYIPTLLFVLIAQRYLIKGLTSGDLKD